MRPAVLRPDVEADPAELRASFDPETDCKRLRGVASNEPAWLEIVLASERRPWMCASVGEWQSKAKPVAWRVELISGKFTVCCLSNSARARTEVSAMCAAASVEILRWSYSTRATPRFLISRSTCVWAPVHFSMASFRHTGSGSG